MTLVSAHRCGAGGRVELENTRTALDRAVNSGADYVEFDVQRCSDGAFVLFHDGCVEQDGNRIPIGELTFAEFALMGKRYLRYDEALDALSGRKKAHIDLKFVSPSDNYEHAADTYEAEAARIALERLGEGQFIITSLEDQSIRATRDWADGLGIELLAGLSLGRDISGKSWLHKLRTRLSELFPARRYSACRANLVVANHQLARIRTARWAERHGLPLLVWTVNSDSDLRGWLSDHRVWMVTTDLPELASRLRLEAQPLG